LRPRPAAGRSGTLLGATALMALVVSCHSSPPARPTEVVFWQSWPPGVIQPLIAKFEAETTGVHVRVEQLSRESGAARVAAAVDSGGVPDLCQLSSTELARFLDSGALADWSAGAADLRPSLRGWEMCSVGDTRYGIPWVLGARALFYDRTLFARAHLDPAHGPETWGELYRDAAAIQKLGGGVHGYGVSARDRRELFEAFLPFACGNGGRILSTDRDSARFDSPENRAALAFFLGLRKVGAVDTQDALHREFLRGRLGMVISGAGLIGRIDSEAPRLRYGVALVPRPAPGRGTHGSFADGEVLLSFNLSKHKEAALRLARFLARADNVLALARSAPGVQPATVGADSAAYFRDHPEERMLVRQLESVRFRPGTSEWGEMEATIEDALANALLRREASPESVAAWATAEADSGLSALLRRR
jgi:multiple sugar transport system substrate-binding protein